MHNANAKTEPKTAKAAYEQELDAMKKIGRTLESLDDATKSRIVAWVVSNFGRPA